MANDDVTSSSLPRLGEPSKLFIILSTLIRCFEMYKQGMNEIIIQSSNQEEIHRIIRYIQTSYIPNIILFQLNKTDKKDFVKQVLVLIKAIYRVVIRLVIKYIE